MILRAGLMTKKIQERAMWSVRLVAISVAVCLMTVMPSWVCGSGSIMGTMVSVSKGVDHNYSVCALEARTLLPFCWGPISISPQKSIPTEPLWAITAGEGFVCGLLYLSRYPVCWGNLTSVTSIPSDYSMTRYASISAGYDHVCAIRDSRAVSPSTVDCWGVNDVNQINSSAGITMVSVTAGWGYTCGLTLIDRKVVCWGWADSSPMPTRLSDSRFQDIFAAYQRNCGIIASDNTTECWQSNVSIPIPYKYTLFTSIVGTLYGACGIAKETHEVLCWSFYSDRPPYKTTPYLLSAISAALYYPTLDYADIICGLREDVEVGNVYCWGESGNVYESFLSSFSASKGLCMALCPEDHYPVLIDGQCPNPDHHVCLRCKGTCPLLSSSPLSQPPMQNISSIASPSASPLLKNNMDSNRKIASPKIIVVTICAIAGTIIIVLLIIIFLQMRCQRQSYTPPQGVTEEEDLMVLSPQEVNVAIQNSIGGEPKKGGFASVYKCVLQDRVVAIKIPHQEVSYGRGYEVELDILARLNHPYLVKLLGYCMESKALVFPYMENGSLADSFMDTARAKLKLEDTGLRVRIALQVAKGLEHMHKCGIIHRDVKPANILLDELWNAHISDFGISRYSPSGDQTHCITQVIGTFDYLDPDYAKSEKLSTKSDVYSFGVVLLELALGLPPNGLAHKARCLQGNIYSLLPHNLVMHAEVECLHSVLEIALDCVKEFRSERPTMAQVATRLQSAYGLLLLPLPS